MWDWFQESLGEVPTRIVDDRGRVHTVREEGYPEPERVMVEGELTKEQRRAIRDYERMWRHARSRGYHVVLGIALGVLATAAFLASSIMWSSGSVVHAATGMIFGILCVVVAIRNPVWMRRRIVLLHHAMFGAAGRCLVCGYEIGGVPSEADGCVVCPECGVAWRMGAGA